MTTSALPAYHRIEAPRPAAGESKIQERKAKADGEVAFAEDRKEAARKMLDEIGRGHFAGQDECHRAGEKAQDQKRAADNPQDAEDTRRPYSAGLHGAISDQSNGVRCSRESAAALGRPEAGSQNV